MSKNAIQTSIIIVRKNKRGLSKGAKIQFLDISVLEILRIYCPPLMLFQISAALLTVLLNFFFKIELAVLQFTIGPNFILIKRITIEKILSDDCVLDIHANTLISIRKTTTKKEQRTEGVTTLEEVQTINSIFLDFNTIIAQKFKWNT